MSLQSGPISKMANLDTTPVNQLQGLGKKSSQWLNQIGIYTRADLQQTGAITAYAMLKQQGIGSPSLNLLYAMVGALEGHHWTEIKKQQKAELIMQLEAHAEMDKLFKPFEK